MILSDIVETLNRQLIFKLFILNSHGGNDFKPLIRELGLKYPKMFISVCNWYQISDKHKFFENSGDHADEMETSLLLHLRPDLVFPLSEAGLGIERKHRIKEFSKGWLWAERRWSKVTEDTGVGNPKLATKEKGELFFKMITEKIAKVLTELDQLDVNNLYES